MPPRRSAASASAGGGTASRAKKAAGLQQPTLSFQAHRPTPLDSKSAKGRTTRAKKSVTTHSTPSLSEIEAEPEEPKHTSVVEVEVSDEETKALPLKSVAVSENGAKDVPRRQLDVKSKEWKGVLKAAKAAMGGLQPIHAGPDTHNDIHHILRVFDMTSSYGPCVGITRLQRWERAKKWGLNPPDEIHSILTTAQGEDEIEYKETVLYGRV